MEKLLEKSTSMEKALEVCFVFQYTFSLSIVSSEGALIAITPYDYPQGRPLFEHTPVLDNNLSINVTMTLVTMITIMTDITKITRNVK